LSTTKKAKTPPTPQAEKRRNITLKGTYMLGGNLIIPTSNFSGMISSEATGGGKKRGRPAGSKNANANAKAKTA
jgi:hypothetical protein